MFFGIILLIMLSHNILPWQGEGLSPTTGSIIGQIVDSKVKDEIPGAIVMIEGTSMGAQAGPDGQFKIKNIEPGIYNLRYQMKGYTPVIVDSIYVYPNMSSISNVGLEQTVIEFNKSYKLYPPPSIHVDETTYIKRIRSVDLEHFPATNVAEIVRKLK